MTKSDSLHMRLVCSSWPAPAGVGWLAAFGWLAPDDFAWLQPALAGWPLVACLFWLALTGFGWLWLTLAHSSWLSGILFRQTSIVSKAGITNKIRKHIEQLCWYSVYNYFWVLSLCWVFLALVSTISIVSQIVNITQSKQIIQRLSWRFRVLH